jgi:hypothetical protein
MQSEARVIIAHHWLVDGPNALVDGELVHVLLFGFAFISLEE